MAGYVRIQEPIHRQCGGSAITITTEGLTLTIARSVWTPRLWNGIVTLLLSLVIGGVSWVARPSWIPQVSGQPRWKQIPCDGLTRLLFTLKIPETHWVRALFDAFDWSRIDTLCAAPYQNQTGRARLRAADAVSGAGADVRQRDAPPWTACAPTWPGGGLWG